ncbi:MAG TPA: DUF427 domain-containing protein [Ktedonobacteraceae bacterium]|nr:DUF427 domain-containing protein [Ktedonobacteraceae bacterium]
MRPALEDLFLGPGASPSFDEKLRFRWEDSRRRVRVIFNDVTIADSTRVMLLHEFGHLPVFYFPFEDVRRDVMEATNHSTHSPLKGDASYWTIRVGDRVAENAAWSYLHPLADGPQVKDYMAFYWDKMDAWYEEDERVFAHARDPYKRVDILSGSRHVRVVLGGVTVADTHHPQLLIETGLPTRYYIPEQDIHMELLEPTASSSRCPYKGEASYWSAKIDGKTFKDVVWSYRDPLPACLPITNLLSFYNERVDAIYVDDELIAVPKTHWSE